MVFPVHNYQTHTHHTRTHMHAHSHAHTHTHKILYAYTHTYIYETITQCIHTPQGVGWANLDYIPLMIASTIIGNFDRSQGGGSNMASKLARVSKRGRGRKEGGGEREGEKLHCIHVLC